MLQKRLETVLSMVEPVSVIADVGTDHGWLAIALYESKKAKRVIAIDVNKGPLESARKAIRKKGLSHAIECRLGNGLEVTGKGEVDCAIMCGMGGHLMKEIIKNGPELLPRYIVQPQSGRADLKKYLVSMGYTITEEVCVIENNHYYDSWVVEKKDAKDPIYGNLSLANPLWEYGALLHERKPIEWVAYIEKQIRHRNILVESLPCGDKREEILNEIDHLQQLLQ